MILKWNYDFIMKIFEFYKIPALLGGGGNLDFLI